MRSSRANDGKKRLIGVILGKSYVLLSLGANLGDRRETIKKAARFIVDSGTLERAGLSSFYETEPVGYLDQPRFMNAALSGYTDLEPRALLAFCKSVEYFLGRVGRGRWREREIDVDVLLYEDAEIEDEHLSLPHPRMHERMFALVPAAEIAESKIHPGFDLTVGRLRDMCADRSEVKLAEA